MPKEYKASYPEAVKDRILGLLGRGVNAVQSTGTGATLKRRNRDMDAAVDEASGMDRRRRNQSTDSSN